MGCERSQVAERREDGQADRLLRGVRTGAGALSSCTVTLQTRAPRRAMNRALTT